MIQPYFQGIPVSEVEARELIKRGEDLEFLHDTSSCGNYCTCGGCE